MSQKSDNTIHGGRNLMILGFAAFVIAAATTVASLQIYHDVSPNRHVRVVAVAVKRC